MAESKGRDAGAVEDFFKAFKLVAGRAK